MTILCGIAAWPQTCPGVVVPGQLAYHAADAPSGTTSRDQRMTPEEGGTYYDRQEVRGPAERETAMFSALPGLIHHAIDNAPWFAERLGGIEPDRITSCAAL